MSFDRRIFLHFFGSTGLASTLFPGALYATHQAAQKSTLGDVADTLRRQEPITIQMVEQAERLAGLSFSPAEREMMVEDLNERLASYKEMREQPLENHVVPSIQFDVRAAGVTVPSGTVHRLSSEWPVSAGVRPSNDDDLAFMPVAQLAGLIKRKEVSVIRLTKLYIDRIKKYDAVLQSVVTLTEERALRQAAELDAELSQGTWRGPLHGIPWGAKDLLSVRGYPTTWGAEPYRDQVIDEDATVVNRLDEAGAVLIAKLSLGALAWGDVWFGGQTKNPWNIEQGSSGSSAGPGSAVAAGLVAFAIGSETLGSIVSPSTRNGVTGLRPTFGRVPKGGAMALSWSMDKLGPMCRSAEDCALIFDAIHGAGPRDATSVDVPFDWRSSVSSQDIARDIRVGYVREAFEEEYDGREADRACLDTLREIGFTLSPITLPERSIDPLLIILNAEAAAAFDSLTLNRGIDRLTRQVRRAWPNVFRGARFIPAVEYIQANRIRTLLIEETEAAMRQVDVFVSPTFRANTLRITNLTGHPAVVVPNRFTTVEGDEESPRRAPGSVTFVGGLYKDSEALAVAHAYQMHSDFHTRRPPIK